MARRKRQSSTFNLSFLDIMSCGFGAVVLVFLIIDHSLEVEIRTVNAEVLSEVELLEEDIREGEAGLVRLRNALDEADLDIVEADGLARRINKELDEYEALIASIEESGVSNSDAIAKLQAEINQLEEEIRLLEEASKAEAGRVELESLDLELREELENALEVVADAAHRKGLDLALQIAEDVPERVAGDPVRLRQVLINLLGNAVKFTKQGGSAFC